ncbi:MAG: multidrug transporter, partial [Pseudomonas sp.]|nr:multidrug transporter [Pseudomonas sp.]
WSFVPEITLPIFNGGSLKAGLDSAKVEKDINVARYEKAIQTAFREVSDGLAAVHTYRQQIEAQQGLVEASSGYYHLAESRYRTGVDSSLTLLDAQRTLFSAQQALVSDQLAAHIAAVDLYKALGGGWQQLPGS